MKKQKKQVEVKGSRSDKGHDHEQQGPCYLQTEHVANHSFEEDEKVEQGIPRHIILVGTKADLCKEGPNTKRKVKFSEAVELSKRLNIAGCFEISSKYSSRYQMNDNYFQLLNDAFGLAACLCVD